VGAASTRRKDSAASNEVGADFFLKTGLPHRLGLGHLLFNLSNPVSILADNFDLLHTFQPSQRRVPQLGSPRVGLGPDAVQFALGNRRFDLAPRAEDPLMARSLTASLRLVLSIRSASRRMRTARGL
jgi:hypothetical protein